LIDEDNNNHNNNNNQDGLYNSNNIMNTSRITNKTQEISLFDIDDEDFPLNKSRNENFGVAMTGNIFEKLYKLNEKYMKKKRSKVKIHSSIIPFSIKKW